MNKVIFVGNLASDPEVRDAMKGAEPLKIARFRLAVNRRGKDAGADFIRCVTFGRLAETVEKYLHKGSKVGIVGRLQINSYEKDGVKKSNTDVIVEEMEFVGGKSASGEKSDNAGSQQQPNNSASKSTEKVDSDGFIVVPENGDSDLPW